MPVVPGCVPVVEEDGKAVSWHANQSCPFSGKLTGARRMQWDITELGNVFIESIGEAPKEVSGEVPPRVGLCADSVLQSRKEDSTDPRRYE